VENIRDTEKASALGPLFDLSFNTFITISVIKIVYVLLLALAALTALMMIFAGFSQGFVTGLGTIVLAAFALVINILLARMFCEGIVALFRIAQNTTILATTAERVHGTTPASGNPTAPGEPSA